MEPAQTSSRPGRVRPGTNGMNVVVPNHLMRLEAAIKHAIKPLLFRDETRPRVIRAGIGRGLTMLLNRRNELQKELGLWEIEAQRVYRTHVRSGHVVVDIGAGGGDSSLLLAQLSAPGTVVAIEPEPSLFQLLQQNIALNPHLTNVHAIRVFMGSHDEGNSRQALDALISHGVVPPPDFVKVDVEGGELNVLAGMKEALRGTKAPVVLIEVHSAELEQRCRDFLIEHGYTVAIIHRAWWRALYPEYRPIALNRWLLGRPTAR